MYIAMLKTFNNRIAVEMESLGKAINILNSMMETHKDEMMEALILEEEEYLDNQFPDFDSCKVIASMRIIR